jgi:hypothetical protein
VPAHKSWAVSSKVRLRILHHGAIFLALGQIVSVRRNSMGVMFTKIEQKDQAILEKGWLRFAMGTNTPRRTQKPTLSIPYDWKWCGREDSNLHGIATASPSSWCVCQFRHYRISQTSDYSRHPAELRGSTL